MKKRIFFRADGNKQIGLGHVSRCCALAQMLNEMHDCIFIIKEPLPEICEEILQSCSDVIKLSALENGITEAIKINQLIGKQDIVVLDGYAFTTEYQQILKKTGCLLVCIDDIYAYHFVADVIINHAGGILANSYSKEFYTQLYLGPEYAMLRSPFWPKEGNIKREINNDNNVLILLGGTDPVNATQMILEQCFLIRPLEKYHVVIGAAYAYFDNLKIFLSKNKNFDVSVYRNISAEEIATLMKKSRSAITAPSTVAFEYLFIGGCLYLYQIADNQKDVYRYFIDSKLAKSFTDFADKKNTEPCTEKRLLYDFVKNIRQIFSTLSQESQLKLKKASEDDTQVIFKWINDPAVRNQSYTPAPISMDNHLAWLKEKLANKNCSMYLFYLNDVPVGQIRFDTDNRFAILSYLVDKEYRGKGMGTIILKKGIKALKSENEDVKEITGFVKKNNIASCRSFRKMGFTEEDAREYPDSLKYTLTL